MPNLRSATDFIRDVNPKNVSGTIKQALEIHKEMDKVNQFMNPKMFELVGKDNLIGMLRQVQNQFHITAIINTLIQKASAGGKDSRKMMDIANSLARNISEAASNIETFTQLSALNINDIQTHIDEAITIENKIDIIKNQ